MEKPVIGVLANVRTVNDESEAQYVTEMNVRSAGQLTGATPLMIPGMPAVVDIPSLLEVCDGFIVPGGRANVHPDEYGVKPTEAHGEFNRGRDKIALPLIQECIKRGQPILGICRGFQEFNVALGGSLHPEIRTLAGRINHRMPPDGTLEEKFAHRHSVKLSAGSPYVEIFGVDEVMVNSLHGQGIDEPGERVIIDGRAPDSTPEAISIKDAPGFALAVQWHPEYKAADDNVSFSLYRAFGEAVAVWKNNRAGTV
ncbi:MAG: gamma-glutamyl-gamma-aminobutyrate hydrolase [Rhodospirillaceae bacterium TMED8]|nr:gamma-glutamyl-gamma-aminobutyrate hydrolase [Magnetovibrio sp.]OUT51993.1 MAG: gamma-glutamyl-gamma-aminobutyrate hydrolase [Rhodospirillaceae bacterium TMED8]